MYGFFAWLMIKKTKTQWQHQAAILLVSLSLVYPILSIMKVFPHQEVINVAELVGKERVQSLQFRFDNEQILLTRAEQKFFFGWGSWGRNRVYDEETGKDVSVTDGRWIQTLGSFGIFGFIAEFGLLAVVVFKAYAASKQLKNQKEKNVLAAHALMIGIVMINLLPNSSLLPWLWLLAGVLLGRAEAIVAQASHQTMNGNSNAR